MYDFTLNFVDEGDMSVVSADCPVAGESDTVSINASDLDNLSKAGEKWSKSLDISQRIGLDLYNMVFKGSIHDLFIRAMSAATSKNAGLRIFVKLRSASPLNLIPWELLHNSEAFMATNTLTPIVRYIYQPNELKSLEIKPPLRVLLTTACPEDQKAIDLAEEERLMRKAIEAFGETAELAVEREISLDRLRNALLRAERSEKPFHIWHHCGHGDIQRMNGSPCFRLALEKQGEQGITHWIDTSHINLLIQNHRSLRLAFLNACHGGTYQGFAPAMAAMNVPAVIGFQNRIPDPDARAFATEFYDSLLHTHMDIAVSYGRVALALNDTSSLSWALPVLFLRTTNPTLLARSEYEHGAASKVEDGEPCMPPNNKGKNKKEDKDSTSKVKFDIDEINARNVFNVANMTIDGDKNIF